MACDHSSYQSGGARYSAKTHQLRLVRVCDECGEEIGELTRIDYSPQPRRLVAHLVELTAQELGLDSQRISELRIASLVCSAGRDRLDERILNKLEPLTPQEWAQVCRIPELAAAMVAESSAGEIHDWVLSHRERPDGFGYPAGLQGRDIPVEAQVLAVCVAYAAMVADRPYRRSRGHTTACIEISRGAGSQFDAVVVNAFLRAWRSHDERLDRAAA